MGFEMDESNTTIYQVTNSNDNKVWFDPFLYCFYWWQSHYAKDGDDEDEDEDDDDDVDDVDDDYRLTISPKPISRGGCGLLELTSINPNYATFAKLFSPSLFKF